MDIFINRDEFLNGQTWKYDSNDSDFWVFDSNDNRIKQYNPDLTGLEGNVTDLGATIFTYNIDGEVNSSTYTDLAQYIR